MCLRAIPIGSWSPPKPGSDRSGAMVRAARLPRKHRHLLMLLAARRGRGASRASRPVEAAEHPARARGGPILRAGPRTTTPRPSRPSLRAASRSLEAQAGRAIRGRCPARAGQVCRRAAGLRPLQAPRRAPSSRRISARCGFPRSARPPASSPAITSRSSRARAFPSPEFHVPLYRRPRDLMAAGHKPGGDGFPNKGVQVGPPQRQARDRALS